MINKIEKWGKKKEEEEGVSFESLEFFSAAFKRSQVSIRSRSRSCSVMSALCPLHTLTAVCKNRMCVWKSHPAANYLIKRDRIHHLHRFF